MPRKPAKGKSASWRALQWWVEPWYLTYALLGAITAGLTSTLLPLVVSNTGSATYIGPVMAAVNLGGLTAPLLAGYKPSVTADRLRGFC